VLQDRCALNPTLCSSPPALGPLNGCGMPASQYLTVGTQIVTVYATTGAYTATYSDTTTVQGSGTFDGKTAVAIRSTSTYSSVGINGTASSGSSEVNKWHQAGSGDRLLTLGSEATIKTDSFVFRNRTYPASTTQLSNLYNPADSDIEFTLPLGQSMTKYLTTTETRNGDVETTISAINYTFEANENITVNGKAYATCRYRETVQGGLQDSSNMVWYIRGKGLPAREVSTSAGPLGNPVTATTDLISGSINGQSL
jgi:hypothetical protein